MLSDDNGTKKWGCSRCKGEEYSEGDPLRKSRNCDSESSPNAAWAWMPSLRRCPWSQIDSSTFEVFRWWTDWKTLKLLPWRGGMLDQPAFVVETIQFCEQLKAEAEAEADKARQRQSKKPKSMGRR